MMTNILDNFEYTLANGIAASPVLFATTQLANMLDDLVGGIELPDIKVMGTGVNPQTTVADLMRVGALGGSVLSGVGSMISNLASGGSLNIGGQLEKMFGSGSNNVITRGTGGNLSVSTSGYETSSSGYVGNSSGDDIQASTLASANESANQQLITAKESEDADVTNSVINDNIVAILSLLNDVVDGTKTLHTAGLQTESS